MIFTRASQYAIRALTYLAVHHGSDLSPLERIAKDEKIPQPFLGKILQRLVQKRLVRSSKGLNGGFGLALSPQEITLYSIVDAMEDLSAKESDCVLGLSICSEQNPCALHHYWKNRLALDLEFLQTRTLQHLCKGNGPIEVLEVKK